MGRTITAVEFESLYRATAPELFTYARRRGAADPEDLVAEVFAVAWRRRSDLPAPMLRRAWLFGTTRRLLLAEARQAGRERETVEAIGHAGPVVSRRSDSVPDSRGRPLDEVVAAALERLGPESREFILLSEWERLTPAEIAVALGIRPGTVRVRLHRARRALAADPEIRARIAERSSVVVR